LDGDGDDNTLSLILDEKLYLENAGQVYQLFKKKYETRFDWIRSELFDSNLVKDLIDDSRNIISILNTGKDWNPKNDRQLNALDDLLYNNHANDKVLVFTQYADTAAYLVEQLRKRGRSGIECVTGDHDDPTSLAHRFSPRSNEKTAWIGTEQEIRVLLSTDVLSEGQNLQDAHIVVNYDLPWAIIRLIQRAGRVDRIGQKASEIQCYSFLPEDGLERIIRLRYRLTTRIQQNAEVVGSDETFFEGDPINIADLYNEKAGILDDEDDAEVDLASYAYQIWKNAIDAEPALAKLIPDLPNVVYATMSNREELEKQGVILYVRTAEDNDVLTWIDLRGRIVTQSQFTILKALQCDSQCPALSKISSHHDLVKKGIDYVRQDDKVSGASLGKRTGVKYRVYMRLDRYIKEKEGTLFVTESLKKAVDDIFKYTMREYARDVLNRQLKAGISDEDLADLVMSLRDNDKLSIVEQTEQRYNAPQIICSMGLKNV